MGEDNKLQMGEKKRLEEEEGINNKTRGSSETFFSCQALFFLFT